MAEEAIISQKLNLLKISSLKAEQKEAVVALLNGKDVMAILPTGFGKSVIFQLFTLVKLHEDDFAAVLVVSPLTSIIEDQIKDFNDLGIAAVKLNCTENTLQDIDRGKFRVVFGSAEGVLDERFTKILGNSKEFHVKLIVVDECHTVETW